ncbi:glycosyltransferase family 4 protein [Bacillus sp. Marseille-Q3570]|uniref:glycosyltransferase family 4 protein n=1 Tax=Bacillus sp. Marseille-Q3570 TaxID=2963522 RepID=UPI0021B7225D|nr:glycosyltransferase [Bacillus sp. Marseille-Q3570]
MKVLFIYYISSGGVETLNRHRNSALTKAGVECHFLYKMQGTGHQNLKDIHTFVMNNPVEISNLIKREKYDMIVVCSDDKMLELIKRSGYGGILIFEVQGLGTYRTAHRFFVQNNRHINQYADAILLPKTQHLSQLTQTFLPQLPRFSFHNCFDSNMFTHKSFQKPPSPIIGWVGRIEKNKNWQTYLEIGKRLLQKKHTINLWMFIDDTLYENSQYQLFLKKIKDPSLKNHLIIFKNIRNDVMADYYSKIADSGGLLCSTSKVEGFGYTLVEAMSCGCPVLTTDSDGVKSIVQDSKTGLFMKNGQISDAVKKAELLLRNKPLRLKLTRNALANIKNRFSLENYATEFKKMYNSLRK